MEYNGLKKSMKKAVLFLAAIIAVVALTSSKLSTTNNETKAPTSTEITISGEWVQVLAYQDAQNSDYFWADGTHFNSNKSTTNSVLISKNPYANKEQCNPDKEWCTCFTYTARFGGVTYYFNM